MSLMPIGILASAAGGADFELISTTLVGTATSSVTFSSIPQTYKHLVIRYTVRSDNSGGVFRINGLRFNSDSGNNYSEHRIGSNAGGTLVAISTPNNSYAPAGYVAGSTAATGAYGAAIIEILDYNNTSKNKTVRTVNGMISTTSATNNSFAQIMAGLWLNTAAITSVTMVDPGGNNIAAGSRISLYGIKG